MMFPWSCWLLAVLCNVGTVSSRHQPAGKLVLRVMLFENCASPEMSVQMVERKLRWVRGAGHVVDATVTVSRTVPSARLVTLELERCRDAQRLASCEYYATWTWKTGICNLIVMPGMMWSPVVKSISPPMACPFKQGTYHVSNATWDLNHAVLKQVLGDSLPWRGRFLLADQNNATAMCLRGAIRGVRDDAKENH